MNWLRLCILATATNLGCEADPLADAKEHLRAGEWDQARDTCEARVGLDVSDCGAQYCVLIAQQMLVVDEVNAFLIPLFREGEAFVPSSDDLVRLFQLDEALAELSAQASIVEAGECRFSIDRIPVHIGDAEAPLVRGETRGEWTPRAAVLLAAIADSIRYLFASVAGLAPVPDPPAGETTPGMPMLLAQLREHLLEVDDRLEREPGDPRAGRSGWFDADGDLSPSPNDEFLIDIFEGDERVFDFSGAEFVRREDVLRSALRDLRSDPARTCAYEEFHIDTLIDSSDVGTTDGMSFSPDGTRLVLPIRVDGVYQIHSTDLSGGDRVCLTCDAADARNDGVRWQPNGDVLVFVSNRDHPYALGGAGGGMGQELYAMRTDGSEVTRLTTSGDWATNYHVNWSPDGQRIAWGSTQGRSWDVMVADFVDDASGFRLENIRQLTHDTTWWETHDFTADGDYLITTNTRAGFQSADLYAIDIETGERLRLTDDLAWDEHAHISPDGRTMSWISARWRPASMLRLTDGSIDATYDFFWIIPAIFFAFNNQPAGFSTELTLMDLDGTNIRRLTEDDEIVADHAWSPDGRRIVFRQARVNQQGSARIRMLTFDDC